MEKGNHLLAIRISQENRQDYNLFQFVTIDSYKKQATWGITKIAIVHILAGMFLVFSR